MSSPGSLPCTHDVNSTAREIENGLVHEIRDIFSAPVSAAESGAFVAQNLCRVRKAEFRELEEESDFIKDIEREFESVANALRSIGKIIIEGLDKLGEENKPSEQPFSTLINQWKKHHNVSCCHFYRSYFSQIVQRLTSLSL